MADKVSLVLLGCILQFGAVLAGGGGGGGSPPPPPPPSCGYGEWSAWSGGCTASRVMYCDQPYNCVGGCSGQTQYDYQTFVNPSYWAGWGGWSGWSTGCGSGSRYRRRDCLYAYWCAAECSGTSIQYDYSDSIGAFTQWTAWASWSQTCGSAVRTRSCQQYCGASFGCPGSWIESRSTCCNCLSSPSSISNGAVSGCVGASPSSTCYPYCSSGYTLAGSYFCSCLGTWSGSATCTANPCSTLNAPVNGGVSSNSGVTADVRTVSCNQGYSLSGSSTTTCLTTGQWSSVATCTPNPCPSLSAPTNGRVTSTDGSTGDERVYSCLSGYALAGSSATTCLTTGLWSSPQPACNDVTPPVLTLLGTTSYILQGATNYVEAGYTSIDDIDGNVVGRVVVSGSINHMAAAGSTFTLTYTASDTKGNTAPSKFRTITIIDTIPPFLTLLGNATYFQQGGYTFVDPGCTAYDYLNGDVTGSIVISGSVRTNGVPIGTQSTLTYSARDVAGNTASIIRSVVIVNRLVPTIVLNGGDMTWEAAVPYVEPGYSAADIVDGTLTASVAITGLVNHFGSLGTIFVLQYNVVNSAGHSAVTRSRSVTLIDTTAPVITILGSTSVTVEAMNVYVDAGAVAWDTYLGTITSSIIVNNPVVTNVATGTTFTVTYNVRDSANNPATQRTRTVIVLDTTAPIITLNGPAVMTHEAATPYVDMSATAWDALDGNLTFQIVLQGSVNAMASSGTNFILTYNVLDNANNAAITVYRNITIVDTTLPVLTINGERTVTLEGGIAWNDPGCTALDTLNGNITSSIVVNGAAEVDVFAPNGTVFLITYDVSDAAGNNAIQKSRHVTIIDSQPPVITLFGPTYMYLEAVTPFIDPGYQGLDVHDGNITNRIIVTHAINNTATLGTKYTVIYTLIDSTGNKAQTRNRTVEIYDTTPPLMVLNGNATYFHQYLTFFVDPGCRAIDTYSGERSVSVSGLSGANALTTKPFVITYTALDTANNVASVNRTVIIVSYTPPTLTLVGGDMFCEATIPFVDPGAYAYDSIEGAINDRIRVTGTVNPYSPTGTVFVLSYIVVNLAGIPSVTKSRTVTVVDTTRPTITLNGPAVLTTEGGNTYVDAGASAWDSFEGDLTSRIQLSGSVNIMAIAGTTFVLQYNVADTAGNLASTVTRRVTIVDTTLPILTLVGNQEMTVEGWQEWIDPGCTGFDTLDGDVTTQISIGGDFINSYAAVGTVFVVTYNVQDRAGNPAVQLVRRVTIIDTRAPVLTLIGPSLVYVEGATTYVDQGAMASDIIDGDVSSRIVVTNTVNTMAAAGSRFNVTYNVMDLSNNRAATIYRTVQIRDTRVPVLTLNGNQTYFQQANMTFVDPGARAVDSLSGNLTGNILILGLVNVNGVLGQRFILNYSVTDQANNAAKLSRTVILVNYIPPILTLIGGNMTWEGATAFVDPGATAFDMIDGQLDPSIVRTGSVNVSARAGTQYTLTYNVMNSAKLSAVQSRRTVTIVDTRRPIITLNGQSNITHQGATVYVDKNATAWDTLDGNITSRIVTTGAVNRTAPAGSTYIIQYSVADTAGNGALTVFRSVTIVDTIQPNLTLIGSANLTLQGGSSWIDPGYRATDSLDGNITSSVQLGGDFVNSYAVAGTVFVVTYNVQDRAGNAAVQLVRRVTIIDTRAPVLTLIGPSLVYVEGATTYVDQGAVASDILNGDVSSRIVVTNAVNTMAAASSRFNVTYNVMDLSNNRAVAIYRTVQIRDTTPPVLTLNGNQTYFQQANVTFVDPGCRAMDSLNGNVTSRVQATGVINVNSPIGRQFTVTYTANDLVGNAAFVRRTVVIVNFMPPVISIVGGDMTWEGATGFVEPGATAYDVVDGRIDSSIVKGGAVNVMAAAGSSFVLTYDVVNSVNLAAVQRTRRVTIVDTTRPSISVKGATNVSHEGATVYVDAGATAWDTLDGNLTQAIVLSGGVNTMAMAGSSVVLQYNVMDAAGNAALTVTRRVTIVDTTRPVLTLVGNANVTLEGGATWVDSGCTGTDTLDGDVSSRIVVGGATVNSYAAAGTVFVVTYNVQDRAGNAAVQLVRRVTIVDTTLPTVFLLGPSHLFHEASTAWSEPGWIANDTLDGIITSRVVVSGGVDVRSPAGTQFSLLYSVSDAAGNPSTVVSRLVTIKDTIPPSISLLGSIEVLHEGAVPWVDPGAVAVDLLNGDLTNSVQMGGDVVDVFAPAGSRFNITYAVSDAAGNAASVQVRVVRIIDTTAPTIHVRGSARVVHEATHPYVDEGAQAVDSLCGDLTARIAVVGSVNPFAASLTNFTLRYTVQDNSGNTATATRMVTVVDSVLPVVQLIGPSEVYYEAGLHYRDAGATAVDNLDGDLSAAIVAEVTASVPNGALRGPFTPVSQPGSGSLDIIHPFAPLSTVYTIVYVVRDAAGNMASVIRTVRIRDTRPPRIVVKGEQVVVTRVNKSFTDLGATAEDAYFGDVSDRVVANMDDGDSLAVITRSEGSHRVFYSVSDPAGRQSRLQGRVVRVVGVQELLPNAVLSTVSLSFQLDAATPTMDVSSTSGVVSLKLVANSSYNIEELLSLVNILPLYLSCTADLINSTQMCILETNMLDTEQLTSLQALGIACSAGKGQSVMMYEGALTVVAGVSSIEQQATEELALWNVVPTKLSCDGELCMFTSVTRPQLGSDVSVNMGSNATVNRRRSVAGIVSMTAMPVSAPAVRQAFTIVAQNKSSVLRVDRLRELLPAYFVDVQCSAVQCVVAYQTMQSSAQTSALHAALLPEFKITNSSLFVAYAGSLTFNVSQSSSRAHLLLMQHGVSPQKLNCSFDGLWCHFETFSFVDESVRQALLTSNIVTSLHVQASIESTHWPFTSMFQMEMVVWAGYNASTVLANVNVAPVSITCSPSIEWDNARTCSVVLHNQPNSSQLQTLRQSPGVITATSAQLWTMEAELSASLASTLELLTEVPSTQVSASISASGDTNITLHHYVWPENVTFVRYTLSTAHTMSLANATAIAGLCGMRSVSSRITSGHNVAMHATSVSNRTLACLRSHAHVSSVDEISLPSMMNHQELANHTVWLINNNRVVLSEGSREFWPVPDSAQASITILAAVSTTSTTASPPSSSTTANTLITGVGASLGAVVLVSLLVVLILIRRRKNAVNKPNQTKPPADDWFDHPRQSEIGWSNQVYAIALTDDVHVEEHSSSFSKLPLVSNPMYDGSVEENEESFYATFSDVRGPSKPNMEDLYADFDADTMRAVDQPGEGGNAAYLTISSQQQQGENTYLDAKPKTDGANSDYMTVKAVSEGDNGYMTVQHQSGESEYLSVKLLSSAADNHMEDQEDYLPITAAVDSSSNDGESTSNHSSSENKSDSYMTLNSNEEEFGFGSHEIQSTSGGSVQSTFSNTNANTTLNKSTTNFQGTARSPDAKISTTFVSMLHKKKGNQM